MNCEGCGCIINFNDDTEFCGRLVRDKNTITKMGCNKKCPQCKRCDYSVKNNNNSNNNSNNSNNSNNKNNSNNNDNDKLSKKEFLDFLKKQRLMNKKDLIIYKEIQDNENKNKNNMNNNYSNNNIKNNLSIISNLNNLDSNNLDINNLGINNLDVNNSNNNSNNKEEEINCIEQQKEDCINNDGCNWDKDSVICKDLEATFYTADGLKGSSFKLTVGNYDLTDINDFEFIPSFISVPIGLRVKIWHKQSYVGQFDAFLGNHNERNINEKHLYKIKGMGSIQICNMKSCVKPSQYDSIKLINIIDSNHIDKIDKNNVKNIEDYKDKLRTNIVNQIEFIKKNQYYCIDKVILYLQDNEIDMEKSLEDEDDVFKLQKTRYILDNIPKCEELDIYSDENNLKNAEKKMKKTLKSLEKNEEINAKEFEKEINDIIDKTNKDITEEKIGEKIDKFLKGDHITDIAIIIICVLLLIIVFILFSFISNRQ